jgi:hypothetical protein
MSGVRQTFTLELETILVSLAVLRQSSILTATLPPGVLEEHDQSQVRIDFLKGQVIGCYITYSNGRVLGLGDTRVLCDLGPLEWVVDVLPYNTWSYTTLSYTLSFSRRMPLVVQNLSSLVPRVAMEDRFPTVNRLSRRQKKMLRLVDGVRTIGKITDLLFPSSRDMRRVLTHLHELEELGIITLSA